MRVKDGSDIDLAKKINKRVEEITMWDIHNNMSPVTRCIVATVIRNVLCDGLISSNKKFIDNFSMTLSDVERLYLENFVMYAYTERKKMKSRGEL